MARTRGEVSADLFMDADHSATRQGRYSPSDLMSIMSKTAICAAKHRANLLSHDFLNHEHHRDRKRIFIKTDTSLSLSLTVGPSHVVLRRGWRDLMDGQLTGSLPSVCSRCARGWQPDSGEVVG